MPPQSVRKGSAEWKFRWAPVVYDGSGPDSADLRCRLAVFCSCASRQGKDMAGFEKSTGSSSRTAAAVAAWARVGDWVCRHRVFTVESRGARLCQSCRACCCVHASTTLMVRFCSSLTAIWAPLDVAMSLAGVLQTGRAPITALG